MRISLLAKHLLASQKRLHSADLIGSADYLAVVPSMAYISPALSGESWQRK